MSSPDLSGIVTYQTSPINKKILNLEMILQDISQGNLKNKQFNISGELLQFFLTFSLQFASEPFGMVPGERERITQYYNNKFNEEIGISKLQAPSLIPMTADKIINAFRSNYGKQFNKNFTVSGDLLNLLTIFSSEYNRQTASLSNEEKTKLFRIVMDQFIKETGLR